MSSIFSNPTRGVKPAKSGGGLVVTPPPKPKNLYVISCETDIGIGSEPEEESFFGGKPDIGYIFENESFSFTVTKIVPMSGKNLKKVYLEASPL